MIRLSTFVLMFAMVPAFSWASGLSPIWKGHIEYDPNVVVGVKRPSHLATIGVSMVGYDLGGCEDLGDFAQSAVENELSVGDVGTSFPVAGAEVYCQGQADGTRFILVLLCAESAAPWKDFSGHGYMLHGATVPGGLAPVMTMNSQSWGSTHAVVFLEEKGQVVRVAFVYEDRCEETNLELWAARGRVEWGIPIDCFAIMRDDTSTYALALGEGPSDDRRHRGSTKVAIYKHGATSVEVASYVYTRGSEGTEETRESLAELESKFKKMIAADQAVPISWVD